MSYMPRYVSKGNGNKYVGTRCRDLVAKRFLCQC